MRTVYYAFIRRMPYLIVLALLVSGCLTGFTVSIEQQDVGKMVDYANIAAVAGMDLAAQAQQKKLTPFDYTGSALGVGKTIASQGGQPELAAAMEMGQQIASWIQQERQKEEAQRRVRLAEVQQGAGASPSADELGAALRGNWYGEWLDMVDATLSAIGQNRVSVDIINEPQGKWGRSVLHEMADRDWANPKRNDFFRRRTELDKAIELGGDLAQREIGGGGLMPAGVAKARKKMPTYYYLRAKEVQQGKGEPVTANELWELSIAARDSDSAVGEAPHALLAMLQAVKTGRLPASALNERFGVFGRSILHELAARDWANLDVPQGDVRRQVLENIITFGGDLTLPENGPKARGNLTPEGVARARGKDVTATYLRAKMAKQVPPSGMG